MASQRANNIHTSGEGMILIVEGVEIKNDDTTTICMSPELEYLLEVNELTGDPPYDPRYGQGRGQRRAD